VLAVQGSSNEIFFTRTWAEHVRAASNNERAMQKRQLKLMFLNPDSEYAMVSDFLDQFRLQQVKKKWELAQT
jgi:hypothetical protein